MKYIITFSVNTMFTSEVETNTLKDAIKEANKQFSDADFGAAENIDGEIIHIEDESGHVFTTPD